MSKARRRAPLICLGLFIFGANLLALAGWRFAVYWSGPEEAFIRFEPSPLLDDYDRVTAETEELAARWRAGDPTVSFEQVTAASETQWAMYRELCADHEARWRSARNVEVCVFLPAGLVGGILVLVACGWFIADRLTADIRARNPVREPEPTR